MHSDTWIIIDVWRSLGRKVLVFWGPNNCGYVEEWSGVGRYGLRTLEEDKEYYGRPSVLVVPEEVATHALQQQREHGFSDVPWHKLLDAARPGRRALQLLAQIVDDALDRREEALDVREAAIYAREARDHAKSPVVNFPPRPARRTNLLDERERRLDERERRLDA